VVVLNHANAHAARGVLDLLVDWTALQKP